MDTWNIGRVATDCDRASLNIWGRSRTLDKIGFISNEHIVTCDQHGFSKGRDIIHFTTAAESVVKLNINLRDLWLSNMLAARRELSLINIYILVVITQKSHIRTAGFNHSRTTLFILCHYLSFCFIYFTLLYIIFLTFAFYIQNIYHFYVRNHLFDVVSR